MLSSPDSLSYQITESDRILVISLAGKLKGSNQPMVRELIDKVRRTAAETVVLNLVGMRDIETARLSDFATLQAAVRAKRAQLLLCALKPSLELFLGKMGLLRPEELHKDLETALGSLRSS